MYISWQTYEGFQITCKSIPGCASFLLSEVMEFILTERSCQDPLEEYFEDWSITDWSVKYIFDMWQTFFYQDVILKRISS